MNKISLIDDSRELLLHFTAIAGCSMRALAKKSRIHPSYASRAMTGKADFSTEQLFRMAEVLDLTVVEREYLMLLGNRDATTDPSLRRYLNDKILELRKQWRTLKSQLRNPHLVTLDSDRKIYEYYRDPLTAMIHMFLTLEKYRKQPDLIAATLGIELNRFNRELELLEALEIIRREDNDIRVNTDAIHLDVSHPASSQNHKNWRIEAIRSLSRPDRNKTDYHLSAVFSASNETRTIIENKIKNVLGEFEELVRRDHGKKQVLAMNIDLFSCHD